MDQVAQTAQLKASLDCGDDENCKFSLFFDPIDVIGQGAFGRVIRAKDISSNEEIAVKVISKKKMGEELREKVKQEANFLQKMNHPNVVSFKSVCETETRVLIAMELIKGGSLAKFMKKRNDNKEWFTEIEVSTIMKNIMLGLAYIQSKNIVHRDLKPENILIGDENDFGTIKIADFGLSSAFKLGSTNGLTEQCGTLLYMAPEFFSSRTYSKQIDIWSCGVIMHLLLDKGNHPFYDPQNDDSESFKIKLAAPKWRFPSNIQSLALNLLKKLTLLNSTERYSANQALQHPFLTQSLQDDIPMTMNEQLLCLKTQEILIKKIKSLLFLKYIQKNSIPINRQNAEEENKALILNEYYLQGEELQQKRCETVADSYEIPRTTTGQRSSSSFADHSKGFKSATQNFRNDSRSSVANQQQNGGSAQFIKKPPLNFLIKKAKGNQLPHSTQQHHRDINLAIKGSEKRQLSRESIDTSQLVEDQNKSKDKNGNNSTASLQLITALQNTKKDKIRAQDKDESIQLMIGKDIKQQGSCTEIQTVNKYKAQATQPARIKSAHRVKHETNESAKRRYSNFVDQEHLDKQIEIQTQERKDSSTIQYETKNNQKCRNSIEDTQLNKTSNQQKRNSQNDEIKDLFKPTLNFKKQRKSLTYQQQLQLQDRQVVKSTNNFDSRGLKSEALRNNRDMLKINKIESHALPPQEFKIKESTRNSVKQFKEKLQALGAIVDPSNYYQEKEGFELNKANDKGYMQNTKARNNHLLWMKLKN